MGFSTLSAELHPEFCFPRKKPSSEVEIDWDNQLLKGIKALCIDRPGHPVIEEVSGVKMLEFAPEKLERITTRHGRGIGQNNNGAGFYSANNLPAIGTTQDYTLICVFRYNGTANFSYLCAQGNTVGIAVHSAADQLYLFDGAVRAAANSATIGNLHVMIAGRTNGNAIVWVDGVEYVNTPDTGSFVAAPFNVLMRNQNGTNSMNDGRAIFNAGIYHRGWSKGEYESFSTRPFQFLKPKMPFLIHTVDDAAPPAGVKFAGATISKFCGATISKLNGV